VLVATGCGGWHEESVSAYRRALGLALSHAGAVQLWARLSASGRQSRRPRGPTDRSADWPATSDCRPLEEQVYCILQITSDFVPCGGRGTFALHNFSLLKIYNVELIFFGGGEIKQNEFLNTYNVVCCKFGAVCGNFVENFWLSVATLPLLPVYPRSSRRTPLKINNK